LDWIGLEIIIYAPAFLINNDLSAYEFWFIHVALKAENTVWSVQDCHWPGIVVFSLWATECQWHACPIDLHLWQCGWWL